MKKVIGSYFFHILFCYYLMLLLAQYTEENGIGLGKLFDRVKINAEDYDGDRISVEKLSKAIGTSDSVIVGYAQTLKDTNRNIDLTTASTEGLSVYLEKSGNGFQFAAIKATLFNAALNAGIMLLASFAIDGIIKAWDKMNVTVEEQTEKVNELKSSYEGLKSEYDTLSQKQDITDAEKRRLEYLERRLELDERILKAEQKQLFDEKTGTKFTDWFDKDNYNVQYAKETSIDRINTNPDNFAFLSRLYDKKMADIKATQEQIEEWTKYRDSVEEGSDEWNVYQSHIDDAQNRQTNAMKDLDNSANQMTVNLGKYADNIEYFEEQLASGDLNEEDTAIAEKHLKNWQELYNATEKMLDEIQKLNGTYDDTQDRMNQSIRSISDNHGISDRNQYTELIEYTKDFTDEEKKLWLESTQGAENATQAIEMYEAALVKAQQTANETGNFSSFSGTYFGERIQHITKLFNEGSISCKEYFDALQSEINNFDASNFTNSLEEANKASAQFFVDSVQQVSSGLSSLINSFNSGQMSVSEYLEGYLSIGNTLSTLTDNLQENSEEWNKNGDAIADSQNDALDNVQSNLESAMSTIESYQDSIYSLEQILTDSVTKDTDEFKAHINVIADDLANIVQSGGEMADEVANTLGTTTSEIAQNLTNNVSNQELACEVIMANTNSAISNMAEAVGSLFETLGNEIANFKVDLTFSPKIAGSKSINILGKEFKVPEIKFELRASGESLSNIGDAISGFGKAISSNIGSQTIDLDDFHLDNTDNYSPSDGVKDNYNKELNKLKEAGKKAGKDAGKAAGKSFKDGLKEQLSDLDSVISGITGRIDDQISSVNEQKSAALESIDAQKEALEEAKEAAVEALEAERDARLEVIETQKAQLEEQIKLIEKQIKSKQDEIDRINKAAEARAREISLQEKQYALEQKRNQRTKLVYTESSGMVYRPDEQGIRKAKEEVDEAKRQIEIANIQKEIDLLEDQKDLLNEQIDLLDEQADAVNKYYDEQIKQTEKFYDAQIKALEKQRKETEAYYESLTKSLEQRKEKFQELTEILEKAELSEALKQLGIDEEALLNGSEEEFNKLKNAYMDIVFKLNEGNDEVLNKLRELSGYEGTAPSMLDESNTKLDTMNDELGTANTEVGNVNSSLAETSSTTSDVAANVSDTNTNISESVGLVNSEKDAFDALKQIIDEVISAIELKTQAIETEQSTVASAVKIEMANFQLLINKILEVKEKLDEVNNTVTTMDRQPIDNLANAFQLLYDKVLLVSNLLGVSAEGEGAVSGISGAIQALNEISLEEGIIAQFTNLKTAIDQVTAAISGGGGESSEGSNSGSTSGSKGGANGKGGKGSESESGGGNSLTGAIESMGETAKEVIGEPDAEGDGTVIGEFGSMETAVNDVRDAIGTEGGEGQGGSGSGGETDDTLVGSIEYLGDKTDEEMGESGGDGIIGRFEEFRDVIGEADEHVKSISDGLDNIDGKEVSCTIKINIIRTESGGGGGDSAAGESQLLGSMNMNSATYNAKYKGNAHYEGTAKVTGDWGVKEGGRTLCGEMGQEIVVRGSKFFTVGDNGAEFVNLHKGDLVFNHLQTKELLSKGNIVGRGRALASGTALANGTFNNADDTIWTTLADGTRVRDLQPGDRMYDMMQKFDAYFNSMDGNLEKLVPNSVYDHQRQMEDMAKQINYVSSVVNNNRNVQQPVTIQVGDINLTGVQDVNGLAHAITTRLPNAMLQEMHRR